MATKIDYFEDSDGVANVNDATPQAQTFLASKSYFLEYVELRVTKDGFVGDAATLTISIKAVDGSNLPTGLDLASKTVTGADLQQGGDIWFTFTFASPLELTVSTTYAIVFTTSGVSGSADMIFREDTGEGYVNGTGCLYSGGTWGVVATDFPFRCWGSTRVPVDKTYSKNLVAIGNSEVWYESSAGTMEELTDANGNINTDDPLMAVEAYEKIFIANKTKLRVADFGNTKIATADLNTHAPDFNTILTGASSGAKMVVDYITSTTADAACTIYGKRTTTDTFTSGETVTGKDDGGNTITFVTSAAETAPPHWYNWTVFGNDSAFGVMPAQATIVSLYRGRLCLTGDVDYPHQWYQSRQKNPWDWIYLADDAQSPVAGNDSDAGEVGDIIIASIPFKDDYWIHGCANSLWYMAGDAAEHGSIIELDLTAGILGARAWCWDNQDNLYIMATTGLLRIAPGFPAPDSLTLLSYPKFITDLAYDSSLHRITMGYDRKRHGITIVKTTLSSGANSCWWYDLRTEGLFPESYPTACGPFSIFAYNATDPAYTDLLYGCNDGYIRYAGDTIKDDNAGASDTAIDSYYTHGPIQISSETNEGKVTSLTGIPVGGGVSGGSVTDSSDVVWKLWLGLSADEIVEKLAANTTPNISGTITAPGRRRGSKTARKLRGMFVGIRVGNDTLSQAWALEKLLLGIDKAGRFK